MPSFPPLWGNQKEGDNHAPSHNVGRCNGSFNRVGYCSAFGGVLYELCVWTLREWVHSGPHLIRGELLRRLSVTRWFFRLHRLRFPNILLRVREGYVCSSPPYIYVLIYEENKRQLYPPFSCVWVESIKRYRCQ